MGGPMSGRETSPNYMQGVETCFLEDLGQVPRPPTLVKKKLDKKNQLKVTFSYPNLALKLKGKSWRKRSIDQQLKGSLAKVEVACANQS